MARIAAVVSNGCNPDPRVLREARWLAEEGHLVEIHAFDRLEELPEREILEGIEIIRHRVGKYRYGATFSTIIGLKRFRNSVIDSLGNIDILHCHDADTLSLMKHVKVPVIFDMHDLHHTWVLMPKPHSIIRRLASKLMERRMLKLATKVDQTITTSQGFVEWLNIRNIQAKAVENRPKNRGTLPLPKSPVVGYLGRIRETTSFELLRDAINHLHEKGTHVSVLIAGDGTHADDVANIFQNTPHIESKISGPFDEEEMKSLMSEISMMYAMYSPERGNITDGALPAKMFEAATFGRPSIVNKETLMGEVCESEKLGLSVMWGDYEALANAIAELLGTSTTLSIDESRERTRFLEVVNSLLGEYC